jgi:hypothetical protein
MLESLRAATRRSLCEFALMRFGATHDFHNLDHLNGCRQGRID